MIGDWSKERLEAGIEKTRSLIAALDAYLDADWSGSEMEEEARLLRKYSAAQETYLKNMEHVLKGKKA